MSRTGIVYTVCENGTARLIFDGNRTGFEGVLETSSGETISVRGHLSEGCHPPTEAVASLLMDVYIVDGEAGSSFKLDHVPVNLEGDFIAINHPAVEFKTTEKLVGMKADIEIQQYLRPGLTELSKEVYVGNMRLQILASERPNASKRKESICDNNSQMILEQSNDFLA